MSRIDTSYSKFKLTPVRFAKWCAFAYVLISRALVPIGYINGLIQLGVLLLCVAATIWMDRGTPKFTRFLVSEFIFIVLTTITSLVVAQSQEWVISSAQTLIYGFMFGYSMIRISMEEKSVDWFVQSWVCAGIILVAHIFLTGGYSVGRLARITASEGMNANTLGVFVMFAIWAVLYLISVYSRKSSKTISVFIPGLILIFIFMYIILGTGSRKAYIASLFVIAFWIVFAMIPSFKQISVASRLLGFVIAIALIVFVYQKFGGLFVSISTTLTTRMQLLSGENISDMHRFDLIIDAIHVFYNHLLFGVGWNNYRLYSFSGQYSHCSYVEVLACTGILGSLWAYYLWAIIIKRIIRLIKSKVDQVLAINLIALFGTFLFINTVQIMYYNSSLLMIMHLLVCIPYVYDIQTYTTN